MCHKINYREKTLCDLISNKIKYDVCAIHINSNSFIYSNMSHCIYYRRIEDNVMVGYSIDFDIYSYSKKSDDKMALSEITKSLSRMIESKIENDIYWQLYIKKKEDFK